MTKQEIEAFRRLCVEYGEARAKANAEEPPPYPWPRENLDALWKQIEETERRLTRGRG